MNLRDPVKQPTLFTPRPAELERRANHHYRVLGWHSSSCFCESCVEEARFQDATKSSWEKIEVIATYNRRTK